MLVRLPIPLKKPTCQLEHPPKGSELSKCNCISRLTCCIVVMLLPCLSILYTAKFVCDDFSSLYSVSTRFIWNFQDNWLLCVLSHYQMLWRKIWYWPGRLRIPHITFFILLDRADCCIEHSESSHATKTFHLPVQFVFFYDVELLCVNELYYNSFCDYVYSITATELKG